ncbi:MAG: hypothetical protein ACI35M_01850 [Alistipes sp.]
MLYQNTLKEILHNSNPGVEYEIALFYVLLNHEQEKRDVLNAVAQRADAATINGIIARTDIQPITDALCQKGLTYVDCSFETQNDHVGPADIVLYLSNKETLGLSVKYSNTCTLNVTGMKFISPEQKERLHSKQIEYTNRYVCDMRSRFGTANNWFRKRKDSVHTNEFIDLIRDAVIDNWQKVPNKERLLQSLYHADSPIEYWIVEYTAKTMQFNTNPVKIPLHQVGSVELRKHQTSFVAFYLNDVRIGHMQIKFNNGILERCKKRKPDLSVDGIDMVYGNPFSSWNFSIER